MHKPENQLDEIENIMMRLKPSSMSERGHRSISAMLDGLGGSSVSEKLPQKPHLHPWWQMGIAASLMACAGLVFLNVSKRNSIAAADLMFLDVSNFIKPTSHEQLIDDPDGLPMVAVDYEEVNGGLYLDKQSGLEIEVGQRDKGTYVVCNSGSF
jgi:hypothetical protein